MRQGGQLVRLATDYVSLRQAAMHEVNQIHEGSMA